MPPCPPGTIVRRYVDAGGLRLHLAQCGADDAPPLLLLHQTPRSWTEYRAVLPRLGQRRRAIALDTPGFGASDPVPGEPGIEAWAAAAAALLDALHIDRADVVGHHTGGVIALELAAARPALVGRLVLSSTPWIDAAEQQRRATRPPIDLVQPRADGSHLLELWQRRAPFYPAQRPELLQAFVQDALAVLGHVEQGHAVVTRYRMDLRIGAVTQPTLVLRAARDPFAAPHAATLAAHLPHARLVSIADGMVPLPEQLPDAFCDAIEAFLDERQVRGC